MRRYRTVALSLLAIILLLEATSVFVHHAQGHVSGYVVIRHRKRPWYRWCSLKIDWQVTIVYPQDAKKLRLELKGPSQTDAYYDVETASGWTYDTNGKTWLELTLDTAITSSIPETFVAFFRTTVPESEWDEAFGYKIYDSTDVVVDSGDVIFAGGDPPKVGGSLIPVDKLALLAPYIALAVAIVAVGFGAVYGKKRWLVPKL